MDKRDFGHAFLELDARVFVDVDHPNRGALRLRADDAVGIARPRPAYDCQPHVVVVVGGGVEGRGGLVEQLRSRAEERHRKFASRRVDGGHDGEVHPVGLFVQAVVVLVEQPQPSGVARSARADSEVAGRARMVRVLGPLEDDAVTVVYLDLLVEDRVDVPALVADLRRRDRGGRDALTQRVFRRPRVAVDHHVHPSSG